MTGSLTAHQHIEWRFNSSGGYIVDVDIIGFTAHQHIEWCSNSSGGDNVDADNIGVTAPPESVQLRPKWKSNVHQLGPLCIEHRPDDDYYPCGSDDMMMSKKYLYIKKLIMASRNM